MLFNSIDFILFLPVIFIFYWFLSFNNIELQNIYLFLASLYFYSCWDFNFLFLLLISIIINYFIGNYLLQNIKYNRKIILIIGISVNLGILIYFKYSNFFIDSFIELFSSFGFIFSIKTLHIILPIGISFYTIESFTYVIDVYR